MRDLWAEYQYQHCRHQMVVVISRTLPEHLLIRLAGECW